MFVTVSRKNGKHCGHEHESIEEAQKCLLDYTEECRKNDKTSDRVIVETDSLDQLEDEMQIY